MLNILTSLDHISRPALKGDPYPLRRRNPSTRRDKKLPVYPGFTKPAFDQFLRLNKAAALDLAKMGDQFLNTINGNKLNLVCGTRAIYLEGEIHYRTPAWYQKMWGHLKQQRYMTGQALLEIINKQYSRKRAKIVA